MRRVLLPAVAAVLLVLPTSVASGLSRRTPTLIAYVYDSDLYVTRPDGTGGGRLMRAASSPAWSPDGRRIAFEIRRGVDAPSSIYTITASGRGKKKLVRVPGIGYAVPAWSPDGDRIAFSDSSLERFPAGGLYLVQTSGRGLHRIPHTVNGDTQPSWSPNAKLLAFSATGNNPLGMGGNGIAVIGVDGKNRHLITHGSHDYDPAFSPDGTEIAFSRGDGSGSNIWVMHADGTNPHRLTDIGFLGAQEPAWAPDGRRIVFDTSSGSLSLYVMDADGRHQHSLGITGEAPKWQPRR